MPKPHTPHDRKPPYWLVEAEQMNPRRYLKRRNTGGDGDGDLYGSGPDWVLDPLQATRFDSKESAESMARFVDVAAGAYEHMDCQGPDLSCLYPGELALMQQKPTEPKPPSRCVPSLRDRLSELRLKHGNYGGPMGELFDLAYEMAKELEARPVSEKKDVIESGPLAGLPKPTKVPEGYVQVDEITFQTILKQLTPEQHRAICMEEGKRLFQDATIAAQVNDDGTITPARPA